MKKAIILLLLCSISISVKAITAKEVYKLLVKYDIKHKDIVIKQAILETGHFKSKLCKSKHNLFGFKRNGKYTSFNSYEQCIKYYKKWQNKYYTNNVKSKQYKYYSSNYYVFLKKRGYASDKNYIKKLKKIYFKPNADMNIDNCRLDSLAVVSDQLPFLI